jgi:hypothetical protein
MSAKGRPEREIVPQREARKGSPMSAVIVS